MGATLTIYEALGNSTWTKPADSQLIEVLVASGGGGGGSGVCAGSGQARSGGGGGAGGGLTRVFIVSTDVAATAIAQVGGGGAGGNRQTTLNAQGLPGSIGGDSAFYNGANLYARSSAGQGGSGGNGGNVAGAGGPPSGYGTWCGGGGATANAGAAGSMGGGAGIFAHGQPYGAVGGSSGGGLDTGAGTFAGGAGRWANRVNNGLGHPPNPAGGSGFSTNVAGTGVNGVARSFYGSASGGTGSLHVAPPAILPPTGGLGTGGSGGGACYTGSPEGSGNGAAGRPGAVFVINHGSDVEIHQGTASAFLNVGAAAQGRRKFTGGAGSGIITTGAASPGRKRSTATAVGHFAISSGDKAGTKLGIGLGQFSIGARAPGITRRSGSGLGFVTVIGRGRWFGRFTQVTPPTRAGYHDRPYQSHYHYSPNRATYLVRPIRALYDSGVGERIPWMAGQQRGSIRATLTDANGPIGGLASAESVTFTARRLSDGLGLIQAPAVVEDAVSAIVRYDPSPGDFAEPGQYAVQWLIVLSGTKPMYVPDDGFDEVDCLAPIVASP